MELVVSEMTKQAEEGRLQLQHEIDSFDNCDDLWTLIEDSMPGKADEDPTACKRIHHLLAPDETQSGFKRDSQQCDWAKECIAARLSQPPPPPPPPCSECTWSDAALHAIV